MKARSVEDIMKPDPDGVLKRFMQEFFPFTEFRKAGLFTQEMKGDYKAQSKRICEYFGYKTIYEYGANDVYCHISIVDNKRNDEPFVTVIPNIYGS